VAAGVVTALGVISKMISNLSLKRMVRAAGNMSKSNHALMRLVRAKFEHACMVSERVENVSAFVDKFLYEYKTVGLRVHTWKRLQSLCVAFCLAFGVLGAFAEYFVNGMGDGVIRIIAFCGILGVLLYLFQMTSDENYCLEVSRNYMVDYLQNVCLHKYEKNKSSENSSQEPMRPHPAREIPVPEVVPEIKPPAMPEPYEVPDVTPPIKAVVKEEKKLPKEEKKVDKDVLIRQILEEFMA